MKRNKNIIPLSRDHHFGLLCCWKIQQGITMDISYERISDYINYFWYKNLENHFEEEETLLFCHSHDSLTTQALKEHKEIRELIRTISESSNKTLLEQFAEALQKHIRFEERILFPYLEETLNEKQLIEVGKNMQKNHKAETDNYKDEFWKS